MQNELYFKTHATKNGGKSENISRYASAIFYTKLLEK
jgi:hypothetical protein